MRRQHQRIVLSVVFVLSLSGPAAVGSAAQGESEPEYRLEEIVITGARLADLVQELKRVPGQVYTVTREDIERGKPATVQDAIRQVPGIVAYDQVGNGFQANVDLRGFNSQPTPTIAVFVDGVRINDPDSNFVNFDLVPIQDVERIEVLPGASAVFGRNALGGVINIVTRRGGRTPQTTVEAAGGSYNHYRISASTSGPIKPFDYYLSATLDRESGFRDFSDGRLSKANGRMGYRPSEATDLSLSYQYVNDRLEQAGTLGLPELAQHRRQTLTPGDFYANELSAFTLQGHQKLPWGVSLSANGFYRQSSRELQTFGFTSTGRNITDTDSTGGVLQLTHEGRLAARLNRFTVGGEIQHGGVNTASLAFFGGFPFPSKRLIDEDSEALFLQDRFDLLPDLSATAAVRFDTTKYRFADELAPANNGETRYSRWTPRAGLAYTPVPVVTVYANYGEGFRVPTTDELFAFGAFGSNPSLVPLKSRTYEIGLRGRPWEWLEGSAAFFVTDVRDEIVFDPAVPPFGQNVNAPRTRRQGVELGLRVRPHAQVDLVASYTYTDARFSADASLASGAVGKGNRVPLVPEHRAYVTVTYRPLTGLEVGLNGQYVSRQVLLNDEPNQSPFRIQDAFVLGARAAYTWKQFTWFVQGNNLTDAKYETFGILASRGFPAPAEPFVMPAPGINIFGGVTMKFENYY